MIKIIHKTSSDEKIKNTIGVWTTITVLEKDNTEYSVLIKTSCDISKLSDKQQTEMFNIINELYNKNHIVNKIPVKKVRWFKKFW